MTACETMFKTFHIHVRENVEIHVMSHNCITFVDCDEKLISISILNIKA